MKGKKKPREKKPSLPIHQDKPDTAEVAAAETAEASAAEGEITIISWEAQKKLERERGSEHWMARHQHCQCWTYISTSRRRAARVSGRGSSPIDAGAGVGVHLRVGDLGGELCR